MKDKLGILSVFLTVDGECNLWGQGKWSVFVRTRGCGVGCQWCDTKYSWSFKGGEEFHPTELYKIVQQYSKGIRKVTITGGEPLQQGHTALAYFLGILADKKYAVSIETSGTQNTIEFRQNYYHMLPDPNDLGKLSFVIDYKLPGSKYIGEMDLENHFALLPRGDFVKFVIDDFDDFIEACRVVGILDLSPNFHAQMFFSPSHGNMTPKELFSLMIAAELPSKNVGLNLQMHKYIWPADSREEEDLVGIDFTKRSLGREVFLQQIRQQEKASEK